MNNKLQGTVKFFNDAKGFGFINCKSLSKDVFVHVSNIGNGTLTDGQQVSFQVKDGNKGKEAYDVKAL
ncbi:cold shock domain-containing protein [Allofrancisella guangzhouensis]|uniref:Cold-shock protein n=1 Tax=Allofrancisella guangzhouensis TaxID=594679 RepID=A0A0A8E5H7_9GAMM|nr:cold shock domain-containing protein [Allofrancisella guangzhouensis]AJC49258.1 cold-shock protein [Allofrancisella guangzhouensis]MBK2027700.1 cold shock domain-containing protein [Allofrancisella guangzhouensis]MBK2044886.1 cold shock domain-containing protein [Allofrancisella guangzhouensis]MBK2046411.1 cold shock domain-containing protein [Allofrancisella guangzhouensis]